MRVDRVRRGLFGGGLALFLPLRVSAQAARPPAATTRSGRSGEAAPEFWKALQLDDVDAVQTYLLRGVDTNVRHPELGPAIVVAARESAWKTLALLAGLTGTRIDATNRLNETALMLAALRGNLPAVKLLAS